MQKRPAIFSLLLCTVVTLAGFTRKYSVVAAVPDKQQALVIQSTQFPNAELERQKPPASNIGYAAPKKQTNFFEQIRFHIPVNALANGLSLNDGAVAWPAKEYLFHIYPSHHFW